MKNLTYTGLGALTVFLTLVLPNHPDTLKLSALNRWPLELPVLLLAMIAIGRRPWAAWVIAILLSAVTFIKLADIGMFEAYNRTFNPILDAFLIKAGIGLLTDSIGRPLTYLAIAGCALLMLVWLYLLAKSLHIWSRIQIPFYWRIMALIATLGCAMWTIADVGHQLEYSAFKRNPPGTAWTSRLMVRRGLEMRATAVDLVKFSTAAKSDKYAGATDLLSELTGHDVIIIYIESYGRASFENPLYTPSHLARLTSGQEAIANAGLAMRSGWLTSPTAGGQSWLAHGTLGSGLWLSDNGRYNAMLASGHKWLYHFAQDAGYRTSTIMPAITLNWPESSKMGFELVIPADGLPYKGEPFNWVTMPDQFTLASYPDVLPQDPRPDFIQIALISSHAPWVPVPQMIPWADVGDGTIFNAMAAQGPTPRELWKNRDNVREAYRKAIDYSLQVTLSHITQMADQAPLFVVVGDHQAANFVAGNDNRDVPVHMIGPPNLIDKIADWNWTEGLIPAQQGPVRRMDRFRNDFLKAFSKPSSLAGVQE